MTLGQYETAGFLGDGYAGPQEQAPAPYFSIKESDMQRVLAGILLAGTVTLGACTTYDDDYGYNDDRIESNGTLRSAGTGAAIGAGAGALGGAVIDGVSPIEGAIAGAVVGGVVGAVVGQDRDGDGYDDSQYYDRDGNGYYDGRYDANGRPMHVKPMPSSYENRRSGERG